MSIFLSPAMLARIAALVDHGKAWPLITLVVVLLAGSIVHRIITLRHRTAALRERRALLSDAYAHAPRGTRVKQKRGAGSPGLEVTIGPDEESGPHQQLVVFVEKRPKDGRRRIGRGS